MNKNKLSGTYFSCLGPVILFICIFGFVLFWGWYMVKPDDGLLLIEEIMPEREVWILLRGGLIKLLCLAALVSLVVFGYEGIVPIKAKRRIWGFLESHLLTLFVCSWSLGFITYCVGTQVELKDGAPTVLSVIPMAIIHATGMFIGESDISAIHSGQHNSALFMFFFNISHFLAILCSMIFVLRHFGFYIIESIKCWIYSYICRIFKSKRYNELYVFWGCNEQSFLLADSIIKGKEKESNELAEDDGDKLDKMDTRYKIIFVRTLDNSDNQTSRLGFQQLFDKIRMRDDEVSSLKYKGYFITSTMNNPAQVNISGDEVETNIIGNKLSLKSLTRLIHTTSELSGHVHMFFLSDDQEENVLSTASIAKDESLEGCKHVHIYCHAHFNSQTRVLEENLSTSKLHIRIIDSSKIAVDLLKRKREYHPISFLTIDKEINYGVVKDNFDAMIVGFGETGREAARFLYEYSAFPTTISKENNTVRIPFSCIIVDPKLKEIQPYFEKSIPAVFDESVSVEKRNCFKWNKCDYKSDDFYKNVLTKKKINELNYIVISFGNDEEGISAAIRILQFAWQYRTDLQNFRIFIRIFKGEKLSHFQSIINYYMKSMSCPGVIVPFGMPKDIFDYNIIVKDSFLESAKDFYDNYQKAYAESNPILREGTWEDRRNIRMGFARRIITGLPESRIFDSHKEFINNGDPVYLGKEKDVNNKAFVNSNEEIVDIAIGYEDIEDRKSPTYKNVQKLLRQTSQDMSNAMHKATKKYIYDEVKRACTDKHQNWSSVEPILLENLAITEHMRWNAAHEMMGYVRADDSSTGCNDITKEHNCLVPWEKLDEVSKREGYSYIDTIPFGSKLKKDNPELSKYLSVPMKIYVPYKPDYKEYDRVVAKVSIS